MTSYMQTVDIMLPGSTTMLQTIEMRPLTPSDLWRDVLNTLTPIGIEDHGTLYTWLPNGNITVKYSDEMLKVFYPRPTLNDAVQTNSRIFGPTHFRFSKSGSVVARYGERSYYWSEDMPIYSQSPIQALNPVTMLRPIWDAASTESSTLSPITSFDSDDCPLKSCCYCRA
jgi:hypothetical protein